MNQVCALARYARVGWDGFENPPPTKDDVLKEIEKLDPNLRTVIQVCLSGIALVSQYSKKMYDSRI